MSFDTAEANKAFAEKNRFRFPLLCDTEAVLGKVYGAGDSGFASRISYLIDEEGVIVHAFSRVNSGTHAQDVLAILG